MSVRTIVGIGLLCGAFHASFALLAAQEYPHAYPREGVIQLFDNDRVTIWEVNWKKDVAQPVHRHRYDMAGAYLRWGPVRVTPVNGQAGPVSMVPFVVPGPYFQRAGLTHKEEAVGGPNDPERLAIMVDLKDVKVEPMTLKPGTVTAFPREGARDAIDKERVRLWEYTWLPKKPVPMHLHDTDTIEIFFEPGTIVSKTAEGKEETYVAAFKHARFVPRGRRDSEEAVSGSPRAVVIELK
jgi:hypothetical protein